MADVQANIVLTTTGGSDSAAEIQKATGALQSMTTASSGMEAQFQHRFQHIGLMLFAGDALRASGLGRETRLVVSALNTAITAGGEAAGISAGGFLLVVTALAALAGIAVKVIQNHKDEAEALAKLADEQQKSYTQYQQEADALEHLAETGGKLPPTLAALLEADKRVAEDMKANLLDTQAKELVALEKQRAALQTSADLHAAFSHALDLVKASAEQLLKPFIAVVDKTRELAQWISSLLPHMTQHVALTGKTKEKYDELTASIEKLKFQHEAMASGATSDLKAMQDAVDKENAHEVAIMDYHVQKFIEGKQKELEAHQKALDDMQKKAEHVFGQIGTDIGNAFAKSAVEGKSFTEQMQAAFQRMAEQIISYIVQIIIKQELLYAWQVLTGTVGSGNIAGGGGGGGSFAGFFPTGGSVMADSPTLAVFGDAGPEMATFTPLSGGGGGTAGGAAAPTFNIYVHNEANGVNDPDTLARQVGLKIIQQIRGQGQLDFTRA